MRPSRAPLLADAANDLPLFHTLAEPNVELRQMQIDGDQALTVIDHQQPALIEKFGFSEGHDPPAGADTMAPSGAAMSTP